MWTKQNLWGNSSPGAWSTEFDTGDEAQGNDNKSQGTVREELISWKISRKSSSSGSIWEVKSRLLNNSFLALSPGCYLPSGCPTDRSQGWPPSVQRDLQASFSNVDLRVSALLLACLGTTVHWSHFHQQYAVWRREDICSCYSWYQVNVYMPGSLPYGAISVHLHLQARATLALELYPCSCQHQWRPAHTGSL